MNKTTKSMLIVLSVILLVTGAVMGTVAYLTDRQEVVNTFTVGNVDITLDETDVNEDGEPIPGADRVPGNEYHLIPGKSYVKDPTLTVVAGSEESYIRMMVTINCISELKAIFGDDFLPENYVEGWNPAVWSCASVSEDSVNNTATYEFRYYKAVDAYESQDDIVLEPLFTSFTMPGEVNNAQLATLDNLEITVVGHAIQTVSFANAAEAWTAFDGQVNP